MLALCLACCSLVAATPPAAKSAEPAEVRARALATQAKELFDAGNFLDAAKALEEAVALTPTPALLYNLGRAYQQAGQNEAAIGAYRRYLAAAPQAANQRAVEETIASLQKQLDAKAVLEKQLAAERERAEAKERELAQARSRSGATGFTPPPKSPSPVPWVVAGVGVVATAIGATFGLLAQGQHQAAVSATAADAAFSSQKNALTYASVANALFIAGPVVALAGVIWGVIDFRSARATVALAFTGNGLALSGVFP